MTGNRFYDCPDCGEGGLIPTLDGTCTNCGRSLEESPTKRDVPVSTEPVKKRSKRIVVLCLLMVAGSVMAFWYAHRVLNYPKSRWTVGGLQYSLTPKKTLEVLEKMMTPGADGKSYGVELQYAKAKSVYRRKKAISAGLILIGIVSLVGAGKIVLREYKPRSGFPRPKYLSDDGEDEADNCSEWLADAKETDRKRDELHCKACGKPLTRAQVDYMLGNPKYNEWCREGFCRSSCFEKHRGETQSR